MTPHTITFIGLGTMGQPMVRNPARTAPVSVFDIDPDATDAAARGEGVTALACLANGAKSATVILMLPNSSIVERVLGSPGDAASLANSLRPGTLVIDMGSSAPLETQKTSARLRNRAVAMIDARSPAARARPPRPS